MGQPIRGMTRPLPIKTGIIPAAVPPEVVALDANFNASIHNRFDVEVIDALTGEIKQRAQAENVICTDYWRNLFYSAGYNDIYIAYGSGSGTPTSTDTALFSKLNAKAISTWTNTKDSDELYHFTGKIQISETESNGSTLTEVGLSYYSSGATIATHAMFKDANGNQISIAKINTDIVNIYATVFLHLTSEVMQGVSLEEVSPIVQYNFQRAIAGMGIFFKPSVFNWASYVYSPSNVGTQLEAFTQTSNPSSTNKKVTFTMSRIAASTANMSGGIAKIVLQGYYNSAQQNIVIPVSPLWYSGSNIIGEAVGTGNGTATAFATDFVHATNATIYVDGVAQTGVTVSDSATVTNNIVFTTPPASGAVITADYHTSVIAKDINHVFDFSITFNFGEYTA